MVEKMNWREKGWEREREREESERERETDSVSCYMTKAI